MMHSAKEMIVVIGGLIVSTVIGCLTAGCASFAPSLRSDSTAIQAIQAEPSPEVVVESSATINWVVQMNGHDVVLPEGWEILADVEDEIVLSHERLGLISIQRVSDPQSVLTEISARSDEPLVCSSLGGCMATETEETIANGPDTEDGITFVMVPTSRVRSWAVGDDTVVSVRAPVGANEQIAVLAAADISRAIAGSN